MPEEKAKGSRKPAKSDAADGEAAVLAAIAAMPDADRTLGERIHAMVLAAAPALTPKTWYGMPAYAKGGKVICFFQSAAKFKTRYATFGFQHDAKLDDDALWPVAFALTDLTPAAESMLTALVRKAAG
jgi:uncharacterized protein YdhG (YjbR/CyaY superfamily)